MNPQLVIMPVEASSESQSGGGVRLHGLLLIAGRTAWAAIFILALAVFGMSVYFLYVWSRLPCIAKDWETCVEFEQALHQIGLSFGSYSLYFLALQIIAALPYFVLSVLIVRRRSDALIALLFAMLLPVAGAAGTWFNPLWQWLKVGELNPLIGWLGEDTAAILPAQILTLVLNSGVIIACFTFPDGRFVPRWTRWLALVWVPLVFCSTFFPGTPLDATTWPASSGHYLGDPGQHRVCTFVSLSAHR